MRPKIAMWSDYGSPARKRWRSPYRRTTRSSIGLKILLVAVVSVAGVIGIRDTYRQIIDSKWVQNAGTHAKRTIAEATTTRRSGIVAAIPLSPRGAATTGEAVGSALRVVPPAPAAAEPPREQSAAFEVSPNETAPPSADIPNDHATADPSICLKGARGEKARRPNRASPRQLRSLRPIWRGLGRLERMAGLGQPLPLLSTT
jgi:hypothetical protein